MVPAAMLKNSSAAMGHMYAGLGLSNLISADMHHLISSLVKSSTKAPLKRTKAMPCKPFEDLFIHWGTNSSLSTSRLRQKAVTLLLLVCMARPLDLAPLGHIFNPQSGWLTGVGFTVDIGNFHDGGSLTLTFFATN